MTPQPIQQRNKASVFQSWKIDGRIAHTLAHTHTHSESCFGHGPKKTRNRNNSWSTWNQNISNQPCLAWGFATNPSLQKTCKIIWFFGPIVFLLKDPQLTKRNMVVELKLLTSWVRVSKKRNRQQNNRECHQAIVWVAQKCRIQLDVANLVVFFCSEPSRFVQFFGGLPWPAVW